MVVGLSAALAASWIAVDRTPPAWDQSHYLWDSLQYVDAFQRDEMAGVIHAFFSVERFYGPGYPALLFPFMLVLGPSTQSGLVANLCLWIVLLLTVAAIARVLFGQAAGLIAMAVTASLPILLFLLHQVLVDLAALTWACLAVFAMLRSAHFTRPKPAALAGVFAGIGLLTKATVLVFLAGPVLVIGLRGALRLRDASAGQRLLVLGNMTLAVAVALAVAAPWYLTNWDTTVSYLQSATVGDLAVGAGPDNPLDPMALAVLSAKVMRSLSFSLAAVIVAVGAVLLWDRTRAARARVPDLATTGKTWSWLLVTCWVLVPLVVLVDSHNQDPRYAVTIFPGLALVFAGLCTLARPRLRLAAVVVVLTIGPAQVGLAQFPPGSVVRAGAVVSSTFGPADFVFFEPAYSPADPTADEATPVMRELERVANGRPARVLVAQEDHVFNINTLKWVAATRHDRFTFLLPDLLTGDPTELNTYDFAIYLPVSAVAQRNPGNRVHILNEKTATTVFGDQLLKLFGRSRHQVSLRATSVWVLER